MEIRCRLENCDGNSIKKFTVTLINENGNTIDRKSTTNGKVKLNINNAKNEFTFVPDNLTVGKYTIEYFMTINGDTTITKSESVAITAENITLGHINLLSTLGEII